MNSPLCRRAFLTTAAAFALCGRAAAQAWPDHPIRMIVPFPPGGGTDVISRQLGERIAANTTWTLVIENRAGAGGNIGLDAVAKALPDGYTIGMGQAANLAINPSLYPKMPYDPLRDLAPVSLVATQPLVVVVSANSSIRSIADMIAAGRAKPNAISIAHPGNGTVGHLASEMLARRTGIKFLIVPYKGVATAVTDIMGGQVDALFGNPLAVMSLIHAGNLRAIAVTSTQRMKALPEVPTIAESGVSDFDAVNWSGLVAPAKTPDEIIARLNAETAEALHSPQMIERLALDGSEPLASTPARFSEFLAAEHAKWGAIIREAGIKLD
jgi:tripartite-type tricarboxylate transporter receptor subunit TctC